MSLRFAGIRRKALFSPNHVNNDLRIILQTGAVLQAHGHSVDWCVEDESFACETYDLVFSMAQGPIAQTQLLEAVNAGANIVNSPKSVMNCYRYNMIQKLPQGGVPIPRSVLVDTVADNKDAFKDFKTSKIWVKRGDVHAVHKEDVTMVYSIDELHNMLSEFHTRGIDRAVVQEHLEGDTVKFYALRNSNFFYWYYLNSTSYHPLNEARLIEMANAAAETLGVHVFGGDAIIGQDGSINIIDLNDWPSFAPVRDRASQSIAQFLIQKAGDNGR